jgi:ribosomal-protein-alanine N-acetyltransferase
VLRVRPATPADIPALLALERRAPTAAHWSETDYQQLFIESSGRVALVIGEVVVQGFVIGRDLGPEWELENVVVASSAQGRGLGTQMVAELVGLACNRRAKAMFLEVRESNRAARALYTRLGFVESGRRKSYYQVPEEDAILYKKNVTAGTRETY